MTDSTENQRAGHRRAARRDPVWVLYAGLAAMFITELALMILTTGSPR